MAGHSCWRLGALRDRCDRRAIRRAAAPRVRRATGQRSIVGFLAPFYLLLGAAAAVPLVVHLLRRRSGLRVDFPAVRYLARAEQEHSRQLRIRNLLLMLLRVLATVLIAIAAARPL